MKTKPKLIAFQIIVGDAHCDFGIELPLCQELIVIIERHFPRCLIEFDDAKKADILKFLRVVANDYPSVNKVINLIEKCNNKYLYLTTVEEYNDLTNYERGDLFYHMMSVNKGTPKFKITDGHAFFLENYDGYPAPGWVRFAAGVEGKKKDICRYCFQPISIAPKKRGHTIARFLGNINIISKDECGSCNQYFNETLEVDVAKFWAFHRVLYGVDRGDPGIPVINKPGLHMENDHGILKISCDERKLSIRFTEQKWLLVEPQELDTPFFLHLYSGDKITLQNVYKYLCKCAIGVLPESTLPPFQKTIEWIRSPTEFKEILPKLYLTTPNPYLFEKRHPSVFPYIRQSENTSLPYCFAEFYFTDIIYTFIVPLFEQECDPIEMDYSTFWRHYRLFKPSNWQDMDLSSSNGTDEMYVNLLINKF